jgi:hypothetical protein
MKCPHCGGETEGALPTCQHCEKPLDVTVDSVVVQERKATIMDHTPWAPIMLKVFVALVVIAVILQYGASIMDIEPKKAPDLPGATFEVKGPEVPKATLPDALPKADLIQPALVPLPKVPTLSLGFGSRDPQVRALFLRRNGGDKDTEGAVDRGLAWLKREQHNKEGYWSCQKHGGREEHTVGVSGLALLAFLGQGHTHTDDGPYKKTVDMAIKYLLKQQGGQGRFPGRLYHQAICTMALVEAYALSGDTTLKQPAADAVAAICAAQQQCGGWDYGFESSNNRGDTSVTGWQVMALKSAKKAGIEFSDTVLPSARKFLASITRYDGAIGYDTVRPRPFDRDDYSLAALTAAGLNAHLFAGGDGKEDVLQKAVGVLLRHAPEIPKATKDGKRFSPPANIYLWYHAALALCRLGGHEWKFYNTRFKSVLLKLQKQDGSWDCTGDRWARAGGKVYFTCLAILGLEVYYRYD